MKIGKSRTNQPVEGDEVVLKDFVVSETSDYIVEVKPELNVGWLYEDGDVEDITVEENTQPYILLKVGKYLQNRCVPTFSIKYGAEDIDVTIPFGFSDVTHIVVTSMGSGWVVDDFDGEELIITDPNGTKGQTLEVHYVKVEIGYNSTMM